MPAVRKFKPDVVIVACGFDAAAIDPLSRMLASADTFRQMTIMTKNLAEEICDGRLVMSHEGGYSEVYVPFAGHGVLEEMSSSKIRIEDPFAERFDARQPQPAFQSFLDNQIDELAAYFSTTPG